MSIQDLMNVPEEARELGWLRTALQHAIQLEFATIPPYLCAMWSIRDGAGQVHEIIESVVLQEMLHMGLACNMLVAIGGCPSIANAAFVSNYPSELPGNVRPGLYVGLVGLSRELVRDVFMQIELPEHQPLPIAPLMAAPRRVYHTIGEFYDAILACLRSLHPGVNVDRQLDSQSATVPFSKLKDFHAVETAIGTIKEQGEGTVQSPFEADVAPNELAHYYRFMQIVVGQRIVKGADGKAHWDPTTPVPFPDAYPMAMVPRGGYPPDITRPFNKAFSDVLALLESAWNTGGSAGEKTLSEAYWAMKQLRRPAVDLMNKEIQPDSGRGNYGPDFRLL